LPTINGMRIDGTAAMIALERETSLRVEPGTCVEIACLSGVLWITQAGDLRDLFLGPGESLELLPRGRTLATALEPSLVRVVDAVARPRAQHAWWARVERRLALWRGLGARTTAVIGPRAAVAE
jgi:Protein of unknown function (DUF2917)